ncbi:polyketide cyclase [Saccharomonospora sp. CUA-673]|uniref:SRPBCC family protein n=1 Tax=Saccharomonospora sp. CUA-673 TaxID=1904969 RepID=UPI000963D317|nr:SRPBCC family protein [Saccharomonospora sp. CUA-673]OLT44188.1 polyketide cyclase [Saccharomonospora sp. CUA-673]
MGQVTATAERTIDAPVDTVRALVADYTDTRPKILTEAYFDYAVSEGGTGAGTVASWKLQATSKRVRDVAATVTEPEPGTVVETDANSTMVTTWTVSESGSGSTVRIETTWQGAGGIGGFFEKTFAPGGLKKIYDGVLDNLEKVAKA